jgi:hypothetical protein
VPLHPPRAPRGAAVVRSQVPAAGGRGHGRHRRALRERRAHGHRQEAAAAGEEDHQVRAGHHRLMADEAVVVADWEQFISRSALVAVEMSVHAHLLTLYKVVVVMLILVSVDVD